MRLLKLVAHPTRCLILLALHGGERSVGELHAIDHRQSMSATSNQLTHLRLAGLVEGRYSGHRRIYSLTESGRSLGGLVSRLGG